MFSKISELFWKIIILTNDMWSSDLEAYWIIQFLNQKQKRPLSKRRTNFEHGGDVPCGWRIESTIFSTSSVRRQLGGARSPVSSSDGALRSQITTCFLIPWNHRKNMRVRRTNEHDFRFEPAYWIAHSLDKTMRLTIKWIVYDKLHRI